MITDVAYLAKARLRAARRSRGGEITNHFNGLDHHMHDLNTRICTRQRFLKETNVERVL